MDMKVSYVEQVPGFDVPSNAVFQAYFAHLENLSNFRSEEIVFDAQFLYSEWEYHEDLADLMDTTCCTPRYFDECMDDEYDPQTVEDEKTMVPRNLHPEMSDKDKVVECLRRFESIRVLECPDGSFLTYEVPKDEDDGDGDGTPAEIDPHTERCLFLEKSLEDIVCDRYDKTTAFDILRDARMGLIDIEVNIVHSKTGKPVTERFTKPEKHIVLKDYGTSQSIKSVRCDGAGGCQRYSVVDGKSVLLPSPDCTNLPEKDRCDLTGRQDSAAVFAKAEALRGTE